MRLRLIATAVLEYDVDPADYPAGSTVEDVLRIDKKTAGDDLDLMLDHPDTKWEVKLDDITSDQEEKSA